jgi:transcriptional/translational regulatory protein YebC/TACO1
MCFDTTQNINRAIKKASEGNVGDFAESTFEAYGFGGASFVINVLSDNNNRATSDVKSCVNKRNGKIAEQGSVPSCTIGEVSLKLTLVSMRSP